MMDADDWRGEVTLSIPPCQVGLVAGRYSTLSLWYIWSDACDTEQAHVMLLIIGDQLGTR